jgi:hypothetical protein
MTFKATGRARKILPAGCKGTPAVVRNGVLVGRLAAKLDTNFFKTVKRTRMKASLTKPGKFTCKNSFGGHLSILSANKAGALSVTFLRAGAKGPVSISATVSQTNGRENWTLTHSIFATAPSSALTIATDASTATGKAAGPFLGGTLTFQATGVHPSTFALGTPGGDFVAKFDAIGAQRLAPGSSANVNQT